MSADLTAATPDTTLDTTAGATPDTTLDPILDTTAGAAGPKGRQKMSLIAGLLLLFAVGSAAVGQVVLKHGMTLATDRSTATKGSLITAAVTSPWVVGGLAIFAVSAVAWLATLSKLPLSVAYPFNALGYLVILTTSVLLLGERANVWTWLGTSLVVSGLVLVVATRPS